MKMTVPESYIHYFTFTSFLKRFNSTNGKEISDWLGLGGTEESNRSDPYVMQLLFVFLD